MNPRNSYWLFFIISLSLNLSLNGANVRLRGSNHAEYWVFVDQSLDSLNYKEHLEDKLKLSLSYRDLIVKGALFLWNPSLLNTEKLCYIDYTIQYRKDPVNFLYGRFYPTLGRGLVLNQFLDEDFRNDNSLFGIRADIKYFKSQLTLLAGKPRNIFFEENLYKIKNDTTDQIRGINLESRLIPKLNFGARYVRVNRSIDLTPKAFTELFGGNLGFRCGPFESYVEYAKHLGCHPVIGGRLKGDGLLATTGFSIPGFGISLQYVDYDTTGFGGAGYRYNEPPTPIKSGISVNRCLDEIGYGISISLSPLDFLSIELENNKTTQHDTNETWINQTLKMPGQEMAGVLEQTLKIKTNPTIDLEITVGLDRLIKQQIELGINRKTKTKPYGDISYNFGPFYIEAEYEHNLIRCDTSDFYEPCFTLGIGRPELFILTLRYEWRNRVPGWLVPKLGNEKAWPLAELSLDLTNRHNLRIRVGGEKGGLVCSGGVCRFEEPFKGVKMVLTSIF